MTTTVEQDIQAKGLTAPRITAEDVEAHIVAQHFFTAAEGSQASTPQQPVHESLRLLTFCVLVLRNGFTVTGESACVSPANFDAEIGRKVARQNAVNKVWPLLGYALRDELARPVLTEADALADLEGRPRPDHPTVVA